MKQKRIIVIALVTILVFLTARYILYNVSYPLKYRDLIEKYTTEYNVNEYLVMAMINAESSFNKDAVSHAGAKGLMQLTEPTADWIAQTMGDEAFKNDKLYDPVTNIKMGIWYINNLREEFGSIELVLAAYNAGRGRVHSWLTDSSISIDGVNLQNIPYSETENYVKKVIGNEKIYRILY